MSLFGFALSVLVAYGVIRFLARAIAWASGSRYRAFRRLASRFGGRYETRGLSDSPIVSFPQGEDVVRVGLAPASARRAGVISTRVVVRFRNGIPFRLDLAAFDSPLIRMAAKGTQPVRLGDREFDGAFAVRANDPDMARDFLGPQSRRSLQGLQRLAPPGGLSLAISPERMLVQIDRNLSEDDDALFAAVAETLTIYRMLREGVRRRISEGVTLIEGDGRADEAEGPPVCKVCGELVADGVPVVVCAKCGAPHHRDCWEFVGWCSIYGCGGKIGRPPAAPALRSSASPPPRP
ncbi:RING finger protein [Paludisphaera mucosa]|uniref:RING finger protein n=1 Tax=Paludisphaera mucosa TaxID=3030827 RepID=A0ABT6FDN9_9BACT|nr:RING finger protein [Paludisphaera mucosa]MDG3005691.1 RING finger protein [Paludisphaera mucosa]